MKNILGTLFNDYLNLNYPYLLSKEIPIHEGGTSGNEFYCRVKEDSEKVFTDKIRHLYRYSYLVPPIHEGGGSSWNVYCSIEGCNEVVFKVDGVEYLLELLSEDDWYYISTYPYEFYFCASCEERGYNEDQAVQAAYAESYY